MIKEIRALPNMIRQTLNCHNQMRSIAQKYHQVNNMLYLGRQFLYPVALEGALKLKEVSYIHAEGYPAGEMKHGPIALVDEDTPSVFLIPRAPIAEKVMSNLEEVRARGGPIIAVVPDSDDETAHHVRAKCDDLIV